MTGGRNECPTPGCTRMKPRNKAFCPPCWWQLPHVVQDQVFASYRSGFLIAHVDFLDRIGQRLAAGAGPWPDATPAEENP